MQAFVRAPRPCRGLACKLIRQRLRLALVAVILRRSTASRAAILRQHFRAALLLRHFDRRGSRTQPTSCRRILHGFFSYRRRHSLGRAPFVAIKLVFAGRYGIARRPLPSRTKPTAISPEGECRVQLPNCFVRLLRGGMRAGVSEYFTICPIQLAGVAQLIFRISRLCN
jgi:hypothetical protein